VCSKQDKAAIPKSWILLDGQSMIKVFSNPKLSQKSGNTNVNSLYCNNGKVSVTKKGDLRGYGTMWYYPGGISNILSLHNVQRNTGSHMTALMEPYLMYIERMVPAMYLNLLGWGYSSMMLNVTLF